MYIKKVEARINEEAERATHYLDGTTEDPIVRVCHSTTDIEIIFYMLKCFLLSNVKLIRSYTSCHLNFFFILMNTIWYLLRIMIFNFYFVHFCVFLFYLEKVLCHLKDAHSSFPPKDYYSQSWLCTLIKVSSTSEILSSTWKLLVMLYDIFLCCVGFCDQEKIQLSQNKKKVYTIL